MTTWGGSRVLLDPDGFCRWLNHTGVVAGAHVTALLRSPSLAVLDVQYDAPPESSPLNFPDERVRVTLTSSREIAAAPEFSNRTWLHRFPMVWPTTNLPLLNLVGGLCLWYPDDPPGFKWAWSEGVDEYLRIVQRHLWCEEYWRRFGRWPVEDAPHGSNLTGRPHPFVDPWLQGVAK